MPDYVSDLIDHEEKKKDKSIVDRLKEAVGYKDYKQELPHAKENLDRPWDKPATPPQQATPDYTKPADDESRTYNKIDDTVSHIGEIEADRLAKRNEKIKKHVGGWSKE